MAKHLFQKKEQKKDIIIYNKLYHKQRADKENSNRRRKELEEVPCYSTIC